MAAFVYLASSAAYCYAPLTRAQLRAAIISIGAQKGRARRTLRREHAAKRTSHAQFERAPPSRLAVAGACKVACAPFLPARCLRIPPRRQGARSSARRVITIIDFAQRSATLCGISFGGAPRTRVKNEEVVGGMQRRLGCVDSQEPGSLSSSKTRSAPS